MAALLQMNDLKKGRRKSNESVLLTGVCKNRRCNPILQ